MRLIVQAERELVLRGKPVLPVEPMKPPPPPPSIECRLPDLVFIGKHRDFPANPRMKHRIILVLSIMPAMANSGHPKSLLNLQ